MRHTNVVDYDSRSNIFYSSRDAYEGFEAGLARGGLENTAAPTARETCYRADPALTRLRFPIWQAVARFMGTIR
ncbi:hypothetical protein [Paraburkholderia haematera]|uniref:hypothetical protein n=1 Tax=Paraburkholderia haematera TaxID=2793077 RepID=UPI001B8B901C|nr:hypothetical protein [Paraburkholderia haematera]